LFEAARILRQQGQAFELLIIGDGPERAALEQIAREAQLDAQVRFAGRLDDAQLHAALAQASASWFVASGEVFGLVVAENMLRALPVVASDLGAFVESWATRVSLSVLETRPHSPLRSPVSWTIRRWPSSWAKRPPAAETVYALGYMIDSHANVYRRVHKLS